MLTSADETFIHPASFVDLEHAAKQCRELTGSDMMPRVIYKGQLIPAGKMGEREC